MWYLPHDALREMQEPFEICRRETAVVLDRVVYEGLGEKDPGIVDQGIDRAKPHQRGLDDGLGRLRVGDVAIDAGQAVGRADLRRLADPPRGRDNLVAPFEETFARIPVCGLISMYNATTLSPGPILLPHMMRAILTKRLTFRGFIVSDFAARYGDFVHDVSAWVGEGRIKYREDVVEGLENAPRAVQCQRLGATIRVHADQERNSIGGFSVFSLLMPLISMKSTHAIITKLMATVINWPQPRTAPCFLLSAGFGLAHLRERSARAATPKPILRRRRSQKLRRS